MSAPPIGLHLAATARTVGRAFEAELAAAGGSLPAWLLLLNVKIREAPKQRELAAAVGVSEATVNHHLNALEQQGLITRTRDPANRRIQRVELTDAGEQRFLELRDAAIAFDQRLRTDLSTEDQVRLGMLLDQLVKTIEGPDPNRLLFKGLI